MRINLETDYAVRIVQCMANEGKRVDANTISAKTGVTPKFCLKILRKLAAENLVRSYKGVGGGYELARDPKDITLREVIEIIGGPIVISKCQQGDYVCDHPDDCSCYFHHIFNEVSSEVARRFEAVDFSPRKFRS
ncbi:MAG: Rrf2 family transcriptional regulator [Clostridia bacterium]|nr:Rrf2 family transcriptional regulator [Clostridia bacterium]